MFLKWLYGGISLEKKKFTMFSTNHNHRQTDLITQEKLINMTIYTYDTLLLRENFICISILLIKLFFFLFTKSTGFTTNKMCLQNRIIWILMWVTFILQFRLFQLFIWQNILLFAKKLELKYNLRAEAFETMECGISRGHSLKGKKLKKCPSVTS